MWILTSHITPEVTGHLILNIWDGKKLKLTFCFGNCQYAQVCQNLCKRWCLKKWCLLKVESLKQNLRIFSFRGSHVSFFRYPNFDICNHSINFKNCDVMRVMALLVECISECIYWIENHLVMKLVQLVDIAMGNIFRKNFGWFVVLIPTSRLF